MLGRARQAGKSWGALYLRLRPAGDAMAVAVARQIGYWRARFAPDVEIKLQPIALTKSQVDTWDLPTIPIKRSDLRAQNAGTDGTPPAPSS